jgi:hypothetical protein
MYCTFTGKTFISPYFTSPINAGMMAMLLGLVIVPVVSLVTKVDRKEEVEEMFGCYDNTVTVRDRDNMLQQRISIEKLRAFLYDHIQPVKID